MDIVQAYQLEDDKMKRVYKEIQELNGKIENANEIEKRV